MSFEDNSRRSIAAGILAVIRGSGEAGLHATEIYELCKSSSIQSTKDVQPCLNNLATNGLIMMIGSDRWKVCPPPPAQDNVVPTPSGINPDSTLGTNARAVHPPTVQVPPLITTPGTPKFTSYKNSLQEYCQKLKLGVPKYHASRVSTGLIGTVAFFKNHVQAKQATDNAKDADQRAAFQALVELGYLPQEMVYESVSPLKRKDPSMATDSPAPKQQCLQSNAPSHKSMLNQLAQKHGINTPQYNSVTTANGFFTTVLFNGREFKSTRIFSKKKDAEQNAAHMALHVLTGMEMPESNGMPYAQDYISSDVSDMISEARSKSGSNGNPQKNTGISSLKNRLQEYCQRLRKTLPFYQTLQNADLTYTSMVTCEEKSFTGQASKTKKGAESAAAESALKSLGLMAE